MMAGSMLTLIPGPPKRDRFAFGVFISSIFISILFIYSVVDFHVDSNSNEFKRLRSQSRSHGQRTCAMTFTTAICGPKPPDKVMHRNWTVVHIEKNIESQLSQVLVLIKSMALMSKFYKVEVKGQDHGSLTSDNDNDCIEFIIFSDSNVTFNQIQNVLNEDESWRRVYRHLVQLTYIPAIYPKGFEDLYSMYKPCATVTVLLPLMLPNLTSVLYLDTDTIFLTNPKKIWSEFNGFSEKNWGGLVPDEMSFATNGYKEFYGKTGLNSGVILLNLTRMRESQFFSQIRSTVDKLWKVIKGDQDIYNIYFHYHPEEVKVLNCSQNYFFYACWLNKCNNPEIEIVHGASGTFLTKNKEQFLRGIFECLNKITLSEINSTVYLHNTLTECIDKMRPTHNSRCSPFLKTRNIIHII